MSYPFPREAECLEGGEARRNLLAEKIPLPENMQEMELPPKSHFHYSYSTFQVSQIKTRDTVR